jgi:hypothetical protein
MFSKKIFQNIKQNGGHTEIYFAFRFMAVINEPYNQVI